MKQVDQTEDRLGIWVLFLGVVVFIYVPAIYPGLLRNQFFWGFQVFILGVGNGMWLALLVAVLILRIRVTDLLCDIPRLVPFKLEPWPKFILALFTQCLCWFNFLSQSPDSKNFRAVIVLSVLWFFSPFGVMRLRKRKNDKPHDLNS